MSKKQFIKKQNTAVGCLKRAKTAKRDFFICVETETILTLLPRIFHQLSFAFRICGSKQRPRRPISCPSRSRLQSLSFPCTVPVINPHEKNTRFKGSVRHVFRKEKLRGQNVSTIMQTPPLQSAGKNVQRAKTIFSKSFLLGKCSRNGNFGMFSKRHPVPSAFFCPLLLLQTPRIPLKCA